MFSDLKLPLGLVLLLSLYATVAVPIMPIDETRYVSVAWEMWNSHSFLVPHLNGAPYSHKPPMLFWLIQVGWKLFGVNDYTPRLVPGIFSLLNLLLVYRIGMRLWPRDRKAAVDTALILASTLIWAVWSFAIMFDMVLTFWILLGLLGTLHAAAGQRAGWLMLTAGIAGGLLTKGPATLVYLAPVPLLRAWWDTRRETPVRFRWYAAVLGGAAAGFLIALMWAVPAAIRGGEVYGNDILWGQTAGRVSGSAAHSRPFFWYLPILPLFFFPWILFRPVFARLNLKNADFGTRFCLTWIGLPLLIFSLVSGKQVHYLIPFIPAGALWMGRNLSQIEGASGRLNTKVLGIIFLLLSLFSFVFPLFTARSGGDLGPMDVGDTRFIALGFLTSGALFLIPLCRKIGCSVRKVALTMFFLLFCIFFQCKKAFMDNYDIKAASCFIKDRIDEGCRMVHLGGYDGQYQFLGRITRPLPVIQEVHPDDWDDIVAAAEPQTLFISYQPAWEKHLPEGAEVEYSQEFRGKDLLIWKLP